MVPSPDQNLLFGIIALQIDFVRREQLVAATSTWLSDKSKRIDTILVEQGAISEEERRLLAPLVARHIDNHGGDVQQSLAALSSISAIADDLRAMRDPVVDATLSLVASTPSIGAFEETARHEVESSPTADGRFRILRSHAKGGLGVVYVAKDTELNREVALKEIQTRFADNDDSRMRFLLEAEVTGGLEHPGIVPVYGLGRYDDGRPFYAMRFIKGDSLQEAVDRFHGRAQTNGTDERRQQEKDGRSSEVEFYSIEFRQLLGRFVDVCQAIEYAHSRGVLHRDLKPGNVMLGKYGETLVVDWGLARVGERDELASVDGEATLRPASASGSAPTMMGSAIGTPAFMPPEQASGDLDAIGTASDVYSLGATLYYLLTGHSPFQGRDVVSVLEQVQAGEFLSPRDRNSKIPLSLNAICLQAMARQPDARYRTPSELAQDVERFLADEPVSSCTEPVTIRARRWIRKHQSLATSTAAVVAVSLIGLAIFTSLISRKNGELKRLNTSLDTRNAELRQANKRETDARINAEANEALARTQNELALDTLTAVVMEVQQGLKNLSGSGPLRRRILEVSLAKLKGVAEQYVGQAHVNQRTAGALLELGQVCLEFGGGRVAPRRSELTRRAETDEQASAFALAETFFLQAKNIAVKLVEDEASIGNLTLLASATGDLGVVANMSGDTNRALDLYGECVRIRESLASKLPNNLLNRLHTGGAFNSLGAAQTQAGRSADALQSHREAVRYVKPLVEWNPENLPFKLELAESYESIGKILLNTNRSNEGLAALQEARKLLANCVKQDPSNIVAQIGLARMITDIADVYRQSGQVTQALVNYEKGLETAQSVLRDNPSWLSAKRAVARSYLRIGHAREQLGEMPAALAAIKQGIQFREEVAAADPSFAYGQRELAMAYTRRGDWEMKAEQFAEAKISFRKSLTLFEKLAAMDDSNSQAKRDLAIVHSRLAKVSKESGNLVEAIASHKKSLLIKEKLVEHDPNDALLRYDIGRAHLWIGECQKQAGDLEQALASMSTGNHILRGLHEADLDNGRVQSDLAASFGYLARVSEELGRYEAAITHHESALIHYEQLISKSQFVAPAKQQVAYIQSAIRQCRARIIAIGDWERINQYPPQVLPLLLETRALTFAQRSEYASAAQAATKLCELSNAGDRQFCSAAYVLSLCAASVGGEGLSPQQTARKEALIEQALSAMKKAIDAGWKNWKRMRESKELEELLRDPRYQKLLQSTGKQ